MRKINLKKSIALLVSTLAMVVATMSSSMCWLLLFEDIDMPKSLYKED